MPTSSAWCAAHPSEWTARPDKASLDDRRCQEGQEAVIRAGRATPDQPFAMVGLPVPAGPVRRQNERAGDDAGQDDQQHSPGGVSRRRSSGHRGCRLAGASASPSRHRRCPQGKATGSAWVLHPAAASASGSASGSGSGSDPAAAGGGHSLTDQARPGRCPLRGRTSAPASPGRTAPATTGLIGMAFSLTEIGLLPV